MPEIADLPGIPAAQRPLARVFAVVPGANGGPDTPYSEPVENVGVRIGTTAGTAASATDSRIVNAYQTANPAGYQTLTQVDARVQLIVGAAPAALDTLAEIATALSAGDSAAAALTNTVAGKQALIPAGSGLLRQTGVAGVLEPLALGTGLSVSAGALNAAGGAEGTATPLSGATPLANGVASAGDSADAARGNHRHPTDITRAPVDSPAFTGAAQATTWRVTTSMALASTLGSSHVYIDASNIALRSAGTVFIQNATGSAPAPLSAQSLSLGTALPIASGGTGGNTATAARAALGAAAALTTRTVELPGNVTVLSSDAGNRVAIAKTTGQATSVQLLSGTTVRIKDGKGDADVNPITVLPWAGATIQGDPNLVMDVPYAEVEFYPISPTSVGVNLITATAGATGGSTTLTFADLEALAAQAPTVMPTTPNRLWRNGGVLSLTGT